MFFGSSQVIDLMERETGIEPATSSLGMSASMEYQQLRRSMAIMADQEI